MPKRAKAGPLYQPSLFGAEKVEESRDLANEPTVERSCPEPRLFLGTSAFTAAGWPTSFYPPEVKPANYLTYYATQFRTVEIDSTYYATPAESTVARWHERTPPDFIFAAKVPQAITHEKQLVACEAEFQEFADRMSILKEKLGPLLLQFPRFDRFQLQSGEDFLKRLRFFLKKLPTVFTGKFVVEIRNSDWLNQRFLDALREHNVALALTDTSFMPRPWELKEPLDLITGAFAYVRWLGNRKQIETITTTWDKTVVDRTDDLNHWVSLFRQFVGRNLKVFAYANNHYAGNGPGTIRTFWEIWNKGYTTHA